MFALYLAMPQVAILLPLGLFILLFVPLKDKQKPGANGTCFYAGWLGENQESGFCFLIGAIGRDCDR